VGAIDDRMNPIVVKELRQAVNSMFVNTILLLFLVVLLLVLGGYLLLSETGRTNAGGEVFMVLHAIMLSTCLLFTPLYVGIRLGCERSGVNTDLLFITTIKPSSIVWGKLISGMAIAMLIFSACAPFMVITYLMRGIDLPTIFLILGLDVLVILGVIQVALTVASMPVSAVVKAFVGLAALGGIGMLCVGVLVMAAELAIDGVLFYGASAMDFWGPVITMILFGLAIAGLLFFVAVAMLTASTANRARPLRLYITAVWLVTGVIAVAHDWGFLPDLYFNAVEVWTITSLIFLSLILVCSGSEREAYGNRLLWKVPRRVWLRPIAFLTTSGAAAGLIWAGMLIAATIVTAWVCSSMHGPAHLTGSSSPYSVWGRQPLDFTRDIAYALPVPVYALAYILTGILLRKGLMGQGANPITAAAFAFLLMIVFTILPFIGLFVVMGDDWDRASDVWYILNPFATLSHEPGSEYWVLALIFSGAWAGITLLFLTPWMLRQIRSYRPLSPQAPETAAPVTPGDARG
ncbi:MAG: hypothetical protein AAGA29_10945, partial [Planctomycetota bacterium]